jgi:cobalt-zinc-cadmium efflux system membrane fusion protein
VVFRAGANGHFEPAPIQPGETRGTETVIKQGLAAGDVIVVQGAYAFKARLLKSQLGEGHAD